VSIAVAGTRSATAPDAPAPVEAPAAARDRPPAYLVLFLASIVADMVSGNSKLLHFPIPPQRILLAGAILLLVLDVRPWRTRRLLVRPVLVVALVFVAWLLWSASVAGTLTTSFGLFAMVDRLLVPMAAFSFAPVLFTSRRDRQLLLKVLTLMGLYLGITAVFETFGPHALVFPRYINDPNIGIQYGRARGPFVESEDDGLVMSACGFAAALLAWQVPGRWRRTGVCTVAACALGILLTLTRSNWIGAALATVLAFGAVPRLRRWLPAGIIGGVVGVAALLAFIPSLDAKVTGRATTQRSVWDRYNTDDAALRIISQHPLTGVGWERFIVVSADYVRQARTYPINNIGIEVHNVFLGRAAELGLPGALLFVLTLLLGPVRAVFRPAAGEFAGWRVAALGVVVTWTVCANLSPLPYSTANLLFWLVPGVALTPYLSEPKMRPVPVEPVPVPAPVAEERR
jgi:putative inorganic carbon (HCO3(-)) transporter